MAIARFKENNLPVLDTLWASLNAQCKAASTTVRLNELSKLAKETVARQEKEKKDVINPMIKAARGIHAAKTKGILKQNLSAPVASAAVQASARYLMLEQVAEAVLAAGLQGPLNSIYQAKDGATGAVAQSSARSGAVEAEVANLPFVKSGTKKLLDHVNINAWGVSPFMSNSPQSRKLTRVPQGHFDPALFQRIGLPKQDWAHRVYQFELYGSRQHFEQTCLTHMCQCEARLAISGSAMYTFGVPSRAVPGEDLYSKRLYVSGCNADDLGGILRSGFVVKQTPGQLVVVPSGFLVIMAGADDCIGLRWPIGGDHREVARVSNYIDDALTSFTELTPRELGWTPFAEYLHYD